jgi:hypothetical protein
MGYKILGFAVWQGGKWYLRRRVRESRPKRKLAIATVAVVVGAGVLVAQRNSHGSH